MPLAGVSGSLKLLMDSLKLSKGVLSSPREPISYVSNLLNFGMAEIAAVPNFTVENFYGRLLILAYLITLPF